MAHVFFRDFFPPKSEDQIPPEQTKYNRNYLVLEIANNWPFVRWLMDRHRNQELKSVDLMEKDWFNFIINNNINVEKYGSNSDEFINEYIEK